MPTPKSIHITCTLPDCDRPHNAKGLCRYHYGAFYRESRRERIARGELIPLTVPKSYKVFNGYLFGYAPDHPIANKSGGIFQHRLIAYDKYGPGSHPCHWCSTSLDWLDVQVDHLDSNGLNNDPNNLVVSCQQCNLARRWGREPAIESSTDVLNLLKRLRK